LCTAASAKERPLDWEDGEPLPGRQLAAPPPHPEAAEHDQSHFIEKRSWYASLAAEDFGRPRGGGAASVQAVKIAGVAYPHPTSSFQGESLLAYECYAGAKEHFIFLSGRLCRFGAASPRKSSGFAGRHKCRKCRLCRPR